MKTSIYSLSVIFLSAILIYSCEKDSSSKKLLHIEGELISKSECKSYLKIAQAPTPDSLSCIEYSYDESTNKLTLIHINAGFNCCPDSVYCNVTSSADTIIINEVEQGGLCNCDCIYDLNIEVKGVDAKIYVIKLIEPYAQDMEKLNDEIDLTQNKIGSFCVTRNEYPWGIHSVK